LISVRWSLLVMLMACGGAAAVRPSTPTPPGEAQLVVEGDAITLVVGDRRLRLASAGRADGKLTATRIDGREAWQVELTVNAGDRFARRLMLCERIPSGELVKTFDRLVESAAGQLLLYATITARDVDRDGRDELVVEEKASGGRRQTLIYRRGSDGQFRTSDPSLWKVVP
jgi:hypothetical protein